jgi:hypothetical protein
MKRDKREFRPEATAKGPLAGPVHRIRGKEEAGNFRKRKESKPSNHRRREKKYSDFFWLNPLLTQSETRIFFSVRVEAGLWRVSGGGRAASLRAKQ